jgi:electron transport complex protein RnfG
MVKDSIQSGGMLKLGLTLMVICLVSGLALAVTSTVTRPRIMIQDQEKQIAALRVVLPEARSFSPPQTGGELEFFEGYSSPGQVVGYAFPGAAKGYSSVIRVMVGVDTGGKVTGIEVLDEKETPGLGDKVDRVPSSVNLWEALAGKAGSAKKNRPPFLEQFVGKEESALEVVTGPTDQKIQAITGATISSRAVTKAVRDSLEAFLRENKIGD